VSITDFGAIGDGTTDNHAAIERAFDYATANGVDVFVPAGVFAHSGTLSAEESGIFGTGDGSGPFLVDLEPNTDISIAPPDEIPHPGQVGPDGADTLIGTVGEDGLGGGDGNDMLIGGPGDDRLLGGRGDDVLDPGPGCDVIAPFDDGRDRIDLRAFGLDGMDALGAAAAVTQGETDSGVPFVAFDFGNGDMLIASGIDRAALDAADFLF